MSTRFGPTPGQNPQQGVKRQLSGDPTNVPGDQPGFRGRIVDVGGAVKVPKLNTGNKNNQQSNIRIPYSRVCPLEFLSSYSGRVGPGDVIFSYKYPPGFVTSRPNANNMTLGVNTLSRVVGLDGLNRLLMGSGPNGWRLGENVIECPTGTFSSHVLMHGAERFRLSTLNEYRLDGVVITNDEPGAFTSSGSRDNALFNVAIQGPVETNNGFLKYESDTSNDARIYNPLTGVINSRTVEAHARGSVESGMHIESHQQPGRVGADYLANSGKTDFVANYCGTYSSFPSQMFDRRVESQNVLHLGLRAFKLSAENARLLTNKNGDLVFDANITDAELEKKSLFFYQYLPFSSRVAQVIQSVSEKTFAQMRKDDPSRIEAEVIKAVMQSSPLRTKASHDVVSVKQQTSVSGGCTGFDNCTYDPIRSIDMYNMVGAWQVGRVMDTKAARHDSYKGGPRDTAFSCILDVGVSWRESQMFHIGPGIEALSKKDKEATERLANNMHPPLASTVGRFFGAGTYSKDFKENAKDYFRKTHTDEIFHLYADKTTDNINPMGTVRKLLQNVSPIIPSDEMKALINTTNEMYSSYIAYNESAAVAKKDKTNLSQGSDKWVPQWKAFLEAAFEEMEAYKNEMDPAKIQSIVEAIDRMLTPQRLLLQEFEADKMRKISLRGRMPFQKYVRYRINKIKDVYDDVKNAINGNLSKTVPKIGASIEEDPLELMLQQLEKDCLLHESMMCDDDDDYDYDYDYDYTTPISTSAAISTPTPTAASASASVPVPTPPPPPPSPSPPPPPLALPPHPRLPLPRRRPLPRRL